MSTVRVRPARLHGKVAAPPSKSYTHRALFLSLLSDRPTHIENPLLSEDTLASLKTCSQLGAKVSKGDKEWVIEGPRDLSPPPDIVDVGNSGTTLRIATAVSSLTPEGFSVLTGDQSIRKRPMQPLLDALNRLGVECWTTLGNGCAPIIVKGGGMPGGTTSLRGDVSSQFISALLIAALKTKRETEVRVLDKLVSRPYVDATIQSIKIFRGRVDRNGYSRFRVPPHQDLKAENFRVPGDFSSAALIAATALLSGGNVTIGGLDYDLPQADMKIIEILKKMGCAVQTDRATATLKVGSEGRLEGGLFDLSDSPDLLPVVAVLALRARSPVTIIGVGHARYKESDRISVIASEISKLGANVRESHDSLQISPTQQLRSATLDARRDHRLFMAFCAAAQATTRGCVIKGLETVSVSYPEFIDSIRSLGAAVEAIT